MLLVILKMKKLLERFTKKNCKKTKQKELRIEKAIKGKGNEVENEIPSISNVATTAALDAKINEVKNKLYNIANLATTTTALTAVENKISDHSKYVTTPGFNKLTAENFAARIAQANLALYFKKTR